MTQKTSIIGVSGHRPERLHNVPYIKQQLRRMIIKGHADTVVCGMASGSDLYAGIIALSLGLKVICAVPWKNHAPRKSDVIDYNFILDQASKIFYASKETSYPGPYIYHVRNELLIDASDKMLFVYDGSKYGGTYSALQYTMKKNLDYRVIDPDGPPEAIHDGR